ncbi:hypothetical protein CRG98_020191 [Punica granatum]|uniref:DDE Tnp4 domain-containing protein n=1 Tax=Punica granatum TaxID=22663 RepID=A0A2I0JT38_PUNGR|nr:hypothetical protein CRG98_020191 [Punica granatum]
MQECMDLFRESYMKQQPQKTLLSAKRSKSVSSPEKPEKNNIDEAFDELAKLKSRILHPYTSRGITVEEQVAIDGTHVAVCVPHANIVPYRDWNAEISQNVLAACSHDTMFTYVMTGWEGSAHDSRIFSEAASVEGFPPPRGQQYYIVDAGFPNISRYLAPYKGNGTSGVIFLGTIRQ